MRRSASVLIVMLACGVAPACSYTFEPGSGAPGTLAVNTPGTLRPLPPSDVVAPASPARPVSGRWRGQAVALNDPGGRCTMTTRVSNWTVDGDRVRFGKFRGRIQPDGSLRMQAGPRIVEGRFIGSEFTGQYWSPQPSCIYAITLNPMA